MLENHPKTKETLKLVAGGTAVAAFLAWLAYEKPALERELHPTTRAETSAMSEADIKKAQKGLKFLGYYTGSVDGVFGRGTVRAVKHFQENHAGLSVDGVYGPATEAAVTEAVGRKEGRMKRREDEGFVARVVGDIGESL